MLPRYSSSVYPAVLALLLLLVLSMTASARDLAEVREEGVLRHLGIPYANFITGGGDGLDVELIQGFAEYLGVRYQYVRSDWLQVFGDLTGRHAVRNGKDAELRESVQIKGDLIANGLTILGWREQVVDFSIPTFPSGVWLVARSDSELTPIAPSGSLADDIIRVKGALDGHTVLVLANTCLDPGLYGMEQTGADIRSKHEGLKVNEMVPAILNRDAETTLLDVPDALIALQRWPGRIKVIGPISEEQRMAVGFRKSSPELRRAFNEYFKRIWEDGSYIELVRKYYPGVFSHFGEFFKPSS